MHRKKYYPHVGDKLRYPFHESAHHMGAIDQPEYIISSVPRKKDYVLVDDDIIVFSKKDLYWWDKEKVWICLPDDQLFALITDDINDG